MTRFYYTWLFAIIISALFTSCQTNYTELPTYSVARQLQAVIEVPAGDNYSVQYNPATKAFESDKNDLIKFLPYPGNYGFIPSTEVGSDKRGLSILVLAARTETATVMEVIPVATLMLEKQTGDLYPVIIAVPSRPSEQLIKAHSYAALTIEYLVVKSMLEQWFVHHNSSAPLKFIGWKDEKFAEKEIQRWMKL